MNRYPRDYGQWCRRHGCAVIALVMLVAQAAALEPGRGLAATVAELAIAPPSRQLAFVEAAVSELSAAYRGLSEQAGTGQPRWAASTRAFTARLEAAAAAAREGAAIRILTESDGVVRVIVGTRPARQFMITAPTPGGGASLERAILTRFCEVDGCGQLPRTPDGSRLDYASVTGAGGGTGADSRPIPAGGATPRADEPLRQVVPGASAPRATLAAGDDGLRCRASGVPHVRLYASACAELDTEIRALALAVRAAAGRGVAIDWLLFAQPPAGGSVGELLLNARGDRVRLSLPALARAPELRAALVPWLQDRLAGVAREFAYDPPSRLVYASR